MPQAKRYASRDSLEPSDEAYAMFYLAATMCFDKDVREAGDRERELDAVAKVTLEAVRDPEKLKIADQKLKILLGSGNFGTIHELATLWKQTHPQTPEPMKFKKD